MISYGSMLLVTQNTLALPGFGGKLEPKLDQPTYSSDLEVKCIGKNTSVYQMNVF